MTWKPGAKNQDGRSGGSSDGVEEPTSQFSVGNDGSFFGGVVG